MTAASAALGTALLTASLVEQQVASRELSLVLEGPDTCGLPDDTQAVHCRAYGRATERSSVLYGVALGSFVASGALAVGTTIYMTKGSPKSPSVTVGLGSIQASVSF